MKDAFDEGEDSLDEDSDTFGDEFGGESEPADAESTQQEPQQNAGQQQMDDQQQTQQREQQAAGQQAQAADGQQAHGGREGAAGSRPLSPIQEQGAGDFEYVTSDHLSTAREKPYLTTLPSDYLGDLVIMEWLEFLVDESTVTDAARAVNYYERIEWVDPAVADHLRSFLSGFGNVDRNKIDRPGTEYLTREHHIHSLKYIMQLNGTTATSVIIDRWDSFTPDDGF